MLHILHKHLTNERAWLRTESLGAIDAKYKHGARMAKERIPQLEAAIKILSTQDTSSNTQDQQPKPKKSNILSLDTNVCQLNLFNKWLTLPA